MYSYLLFFHFSRGKFSLSPGYRNCKSCGNLMNQTRGIWSSTSLRASMKCKWDGFFLMRAGGAKFLYSAPRNVTKTVKAKTQWNDVSVFSRLWVNNLKREPGNDVELAPVKWVQRGTIFRCYFRCKSVEIESWLLHLRLVKRLKLLRNGLTCFGSNIFHILMAESPLPQAIETNE